MTKADLIEEVSRVVEMTRKESEVIVEAIFDSIVKSLRTGDKIEIRGFGSFRTRQRQPRIGRNPKTGARVEVPAKKIPYFKPSKELKDVVNNSAVPATPVAAAPPAPIRYPTPDTHGVLPDPRASIMDYLWTPWRYQYVTKPDDPGVCVFCAASQSADDAKTLVVYRAAHNLVILNRYPYCSGHVMVVPYAHVASLEEMNDDALVELVRLAQQCEKHLRAVYHPDGLNLGINLGKSAGAGIAGHLHLHVLPRWTGDTNFMTVVSETRVVPESLDVTFEKLRAAFQKVDGVA